MCECREERERERSRLNACSDKETNGSETSKILATSKVESRTRFASLARSLAGREDERAYQRLGPVTYYYIDETLAGLVLFYSLSRLHIPFNIMRICSFRNLFS